MRQFAEMASIPNPYLSQIERGLREPSQRVVAAIARSFEMSAELSMRRRRRAARAAQSDVRQALQSDPAVTSRQRRAVFEVYDAFVALKARRSGRFSWVGRLATFPRASAGVGGLARRRRCRCARSERR